MIILCFAIFFIVKLRKKRPSVSIYRWRRELSLDKHRAIFNDLYNNVNGFALSHQARQLNDTCELVYGEIIFEPFIALVSMCHPNADTIFYDLGSGTGKAVLASAMVFNIKKSIGIELLPNLHQCAKTKHYQLMTLNDDYPAARNIDFINANFLTINLRDATILFINSTAFFGEYWKEISTHLEQIPPGAQVISTSKALVSDGFTLQRLTRVMMSWGVVTAYIQERKETEQLIDKIE